jgi:hypothetical protein
MDTASTIVKAVKLPTFDGKRESYQLWLTRFKAYAAVHLFIAALGNSKETDLPADEATVVDTSTAAGKREEAAKKRNNIAIG